MSFQFDHWEIEDHCFRFKKAQALKKKVHYSKVCMVVLIPTRQEFREAGLELWDNRHDMDSSASSEDYFRDSPLPNEEDLQKKLEEEKLAASPPLGTRVN